MNRALFWLALALCLAPLFPIPESVLALTAPGALVLGILLALTLGNPFSAASKQISRTLLQAAVVLLGFSLDIHDVLKAGTKGIGFALVSISAVFLLGWLLQKLLRVRPLTSLLVSTGTAICGGSAIAAMATVTDAPQEDVSVAVGTVFLLNGVALLIFPPIGHSLGMSGDAFGTWAGIAIHDVSSVVGAATAFGSGALTTATAVKLSRVLYLVPVVLISTAIRSASARKAREAGEAPTPNPLSQVPDNRANDSHAGAGKPRDGARTPIPWFIGFFLLASLACSYLPAVKAEGTIIKHVASAGFAMALFLIGAGISRKTLKAVGVRPLIQGVALWLFMCVAALAVVGR